MIFGSDTCKEGPFCIFTYNYLFHARVCNNVFIIIKFYDKQWEKRKNFWNYIAYWVLYIFT